MGGFFFGFEQVKDNVLALLTEVRQEPVRALHQNLTRMRNIGATRVCALKVPLAG